MHPSLPRLPEQTQTPDGRAVHGFSARMEIPWLRCHPLPSDPTAKSSPSSTTFPSQSLDGMLALLRPSRASSRAALQTVLFDLYSRVYTHIRMGRKPEG